MEQCSAWCRVSHTPLLALGVACHYFISCAKVQKLFMFLEMKPSLRGVAHFPAPGTSKTHVTSVIFTRLGEALEENSSLLKQPLAPFSVPRRPQGDLCLPDGVSVSEALILWCCGHVRMGLGAGNV